MKYLLLFLTIVLSSSPAMGSDSLPAIPPGEDVIVSLKKGGIAPFQGQLFDNDTALRWGLWLQQYKARLGLERLRGEEICKVKLHYSDEVLKIHDEKSSTIEIDLKERLARTDEKLKQAEYQLHNPAWYESGVFHFALGVATAGAIVWVGARIVK